MFTPFAFIQTIPAGGGGGGDADATAYINAVLAAGGELSAGQQTAINTFFVDLKSDGIYSKLYC